MPARARDHLQRTRPPHELSFTTRPQDNKRPSLSWQGGAQSTICAQEPALGPNHGLRPEMSPTRPRAIFATATRHPGEGLCHCHHVSWAATPTHLSPPTRYLLPGKGAGAPAHTYAPAPHSRQSALEATQPHLTARRPRPQTRPLLLPHAHRGRSTARRPLAEMRHLHTNTRPSPCSPSHRAAAPQSGFSSYNILRSLSTCEQLSRRKQASLPPTWGLRRAARQPPYPPADARQRHRPSAHCTAKWAIRLLRTMVSWCPRTVGYGAKRAAPA
jgi:hypothetical protein